MVGLFYAAVHWVNAYYCLKERQPFEGHHHQRNSWIAQQDELFPDVFAAYMELKDRSEAARYRMRPFLAEDVTRLRSEAFEAIRSVLRGLLPASSL